MRFIPARLFFCLVSWGISLDGHVHTGKVCVCDDLYPHTLCDLLVLPPPRRLLTADVGLSNSNPVDPTSFPKCLEAKTTAQQAAKDHGTRRRHGPLAPVNGPGAPSGNRDRFLCPERNKIHLGEASQPKGGSQACQAASRSFCSDNNSRSKPGRRKRRVPVTARAAHQ